jgi:thiamine biosynthesis protein ThiI
VPALLLVRYGELALKSPPVRREFERTLRHNVLEHFAVAGVACRMRADHGHLYVEADDGPTAIRILRRVFGITSVSEVVEVPTDRDQIRDGLLALAAPRLASGTSFAVRARRTGQHAFTSQQLAADLGGDILERFAGLDLHVDLEHPTTEFHVEVRDQRTYLYTDRAAGPGGLPLGVAGRVVALVDGPRGALGAYLLMKRGCRCAILPTAAGAPFVEEVLRRFDPHATVAAPAVTAKEVDDALGALADEGRADGIVLPLRVEDYPDARQRWGERVLFSPTVGLSDEEVMGRWHAAAQLAA